ncbi:MAG: putative toxin-antitoxin system toxin component, PIN family [Candidatus Methylomirabilales bacterium]
MLRVVVDTNGYVSAFNFGGPPLEILLLAIRREIAIFITPSILKEVEGVLLRKFKWPAEQVREAVSTIRRFAQSVAPHEKIDLLKEDESDNRILECAVEANAHVIVSGDKHLQTLGAFRGIAVMSPREFLDAYSAGVFNAL